MSSRLHRRAGPNHSRMGKYLNGLGWTDDVDNFLNDTGSYAVEVFYEPQPVGERVSYPNLNIETATAASWWDQYGKDVVTGLKETGMALLTLQQQRELNEANLIRAQRGLSPLSPSQFAPQVNVGMSPDTKKLLIYGAIAAGAVMLLSGSRRRA